MHGLAVACLVCKGAGNGPLFGSWAGDQVIVAGEYSQADEWGMRTRTDETPDRNLYFMARDDFENIGYKALAMLCDLDPSLPDDFAIRAKTSGSLLITLGLVVFQLQNKPIEIALVKNIGKDWSKRLAEECDKRAQRPPHSSE